MTASIASESASPPHVRQLRSCLQALLVYLWLVVLMAVTLVVAQLSGRGTDGFRINAAYDILELHLGAAIVATAAAFGIRMTGRAPRWGAKVALALLPLLLVTSVDRIALLAYPPCPPDPGTARFVTHPTRLWALRPNTEVRSLGIRLNERAMRGPVIPFAKSEGEQRVLILGDSVAFGFGVAYEEGFDRVAAVRLREDGIERVTIVNLSVPGYAPWQHVDVLRHEGIAYEPDVVIYAFCLNDVIDWFWRDPAIRRPPPFRYEIFESSGLLRLVRGLRHDLSPAAATRAAIRERFAMEPLLADADTPGVHEAWRVTLDHISQLVAFARERGRRVGIILFPAAGQVASHSDTDSRPQRRLCEFAETNGVPYLDLLGAFRLCVERPGCNAGDLFVDGWHPSAKGHEVAGAAFAEFLASELLRP